MGKPVLMEETVTVIFHTWGKQCVTRIEDLEEAIRWLTVVERDKGWLSADVILAEDGTVLMDGDAIAAALGEG